MTFPNSMDYSYLFDVFSRALGVSALDWLWYLFCSGVVIMFLFRFVKIWRVGGPGECISHLSQNTRSPNDMHTAVTQSVWNSLPHGMVMATALNGFKKSLGKFMLMPWQLNGASMIRSNGRSRPEVDYPLGTESACLGVGGGKLSPICTAAGCCA